MGSWCHRVAVASFFAVACAACGPGDPAPASGPGGTAASTGAGAGGDGGTGSDGPTQIRVGQFNLRELSTDKLLDPADEQASAAAEIVHRFAPDVLCVNEMQYDIVHVPASELPGAPSGAKPGAVDGGAENARRLADRIAALGPEAAYPEAVITLGNSGFDFTGGTGSFALRGWGEFRGRYNTAVLSRFPILTDQVRVVYDFSWADLPDNNLAKMKAATGEEPPAGFPLFEKGIIVVPVQVGEQVIHMVLMHPVSTAFEAINPYRNDDELRGLSLFLDGKLPGVEPLPEGARFVVVGDLNADPDGDGDGSVPGSIEQVVDHPAVTKFFPAGAGTGGKNAQFDTFLSGCGRDDGTTVADPTTKSQWQFDYVLPSKTLGEPIGGEVFFPDFMTARADFDLACHGSDHRFVYEDVQLVP